MRFFVLMLVVSGCGPMMNQFDVPCAGSKMRCDCVTSCTTGLSASAGAVSKGSVTVTFEEGEGCEPSCR